MANWHYEKHDYDANGQVLYSGYHKNPKANENDSGWYIASFVWDSSGNMTTKKKWIGKWSERTNGLP